MCSKLLEFYFLLDSKLYDIILVTETWLTENYSDGLFASRGYDCVRKDRLNSRGGGVAVFVKSGIGFERVRIDTNFEFVCLDIGSVRFCVVYREPQGTLNNFELLIEDLEKICATKKSIVFCGDFNIKNVTWETPYIAHDPFGIELLQFIFGHDFSQLCLDSTHCSGGILDLVFCNNNIVRNLSIKEPFSHNCDHNSIFFQIAASHRKESGDGHKIRDYKSADYVGIFQCLSFTNFDALFEDLNSDEMYNIFVAVMQNLIDLFVPLVNLKTFSRDKVWKPDTKSAYKDLQKELKRYNKCRSVINWNSKKAAHYLFRRLSRRDKIVYENSLLSGDRKKFFGHIKKQKKVIQEIPSLKYEDRTAETDKEKVNLFNDFFTDVFSKDNGLLPDINFDENPTKMPDLYFEEIDVYNVIEKLAPKFSTGPDLLNNFFIKKCAFFIASPIKKIMNVSLATGKIPKYWKIANVIPIYKNKGSNQDVSNYRPISLTSNVSKIFEKLICEKIMKFCRQHNIISGNQHGFMSMRSTLTQLFSSLNLYTTEIDLRNCIDVIYLDLAKAFDSVSHPKMIHKFEKYGISGNTLNIIKDFLKDRKQRVTLNECFSAWSDVESGVPQGSAIGPLLFILFINDSENVILNSIMKYFADDSKIIKVIRGLIDQQQLQDDLDSFAEWCNSWQLNISVGKCAFQSFGQKDLESEYKLGSTYLNYEQYFRDLGVIVDDLLKFSYNCQTVTRKAYGVMHMLLKAVDSRHPKLMKTMFVSYIRPILEYCSPVWSPKLKQDIVILEKVQRRFTKKVLGLYDCTYSERLNILGLESLEYRRLKIDLIFMYKLIHGYFDVDVQAFITFSEIKFTRNSSALKLVQPKSRLDIRHNFITVRIIPLWNKIASNLDGVTSLKSFTNLLETDQMVTLISAHLPTA